MRVLDWLSERTLGLGRDAGSTALYVRQWLRGNRIPVSAGADLPTASARFDPARPPLLLLHGYMATRGSLHLLERHLTERGYLVFTYRIGPLNLGGIRQAAGVIARKVEALVTQTPVRQVNIVGHSMGGLVGLCYVKCLGGRDRVGKLIMLGSPVGGTWSAVLGLVTSPLGRASVELLPMSPLLRELRTGPMPRGVEVITVSGARDFFAPDAVTRLEGARHLTLPTTHTGLLVDPNVADTIDQLLAPQAAAARGGEGATNGTKADPIP
jgi:pimeloyl-ACP methyl ester carboxylesterase